MEPHDGRVIGAQPCFLWIDPKLMLLQKGKDLGQILGVLFPGLVIKNQPVDVYEKPGELAEDRR